MRMKLFFICFLTAFALCCKAQDSSIKQTELKQITMKPGNHTNEKIFFYGTERIKEKDLAPYLLNFNSSAEEYKKARSYQKAIYFVLGSEVLFGAAGIATIKQNHNLGESFFGAGCAAIATSIYLVIKRNVHRNKAIKLYNQSIL